VEENFVQYVLVNYGTLNFCSLKKFMLDSKRKTKAHKSAGITDKSKPRARKYGESYMSRFHANYYY
jgi:hypothetical protein